MSVSDLAKKWKKSGSGGVAGLAAKWRTEKPAESVDSGFMDLRRAVQQPTAGERAAADALSSTPKPFTRKVAKPKEPEQKRKPYGLASSYQEAVDSPEVEREALRVMEEPGSAKDKRPGYAPETPGYIASTWVSDAQRAAAEDFIGRAELTGHGPEEIHDALVVEMGQTVADAMLPRIQDRWSAAHPSDYLNWVTETMGEGAGSLVQRTGLDENHWAVRTAQKVGGLVPFFTPAMPVFMAGQIQQGGTRDPITGKLGVVGMGRHMLDNAEDLLRKGGQAPGQIGDVSRGVLSLAGGDTSAELDYLGRPKTLSLEDIPEAVQLAMDAGIMVGGVKHGLKAVGEFKDLGTSSSFYKGIEAAAKGDAKTAAKYFKRGALRQAGLKSTSTEADALAEDVLANPGDYANLRVIKDPGGKSYLAAPDITEGVSLAPKKGVAPVEQYTEHPTALQMAAAGARMPEKKEVQPGGFREIPANPDEVSDSGEVQTEGTPAPVVSETETGIDTSAAADFVSRSLSDSQFVGKLYLRDVTEKEAGDIKAATGADMTGARHELVANDIRHAMKQHGDPLAEAAKGQVPLAQDDLLRIPEILDSYDGIEDGGVHGGRQSVIYRKRVNGEVFYVEREAKEGVLRTKTMWKKPAPGADDRLAPNSDTTSGTSEVPASPDTDNNTTSAFEVNRPVEQVFGTREEAGADLARRTTTEIAERGKAWVSPTTEVLVKGKATLINTREHLTAAGLEPVPGELNYWRAKGANDASKGGDIAGTSEPNNFIYEGESLAQLEARHKARQARVKELRAKAKSEPGSTGPAHQALVDAERSAKAAGMKLSAARKAYDASTASAKQAEVSDGGSDGSARVEKMRVNGKLQDVELTPELAKEWDSANDRFRQNMNYAESLPDATDRAEARKRAERNLASDRRAIARKAAGKEPRGASGNNPGSRAKTAEPYDPFEETNEGAIGEPPARPGPANAAEVVKPRDIVRELRKALAPIRTGRFDKGIEGLRRTLGIFKVRESVIRTGRANDIPTIAHEVGHWLHKLLFPDPATVGGELRDAAIPEQFRAELSKLGYDKSATEGLAHVVERWITGGSPGLKAPEFWNYLQERLGKEHPRVLKLLENAKDNYRKWNAQSPTGKVLSTMSIGESPEARSYTWRRCYSDWIDGLDPMRDTLDKITGGEDPRAAANPFVQAWLVRGAAGKARSWVEHGITDAAGKKIGKSLKERLAPVADRLDDFRAYMVAKHGIDVIDRLGPDAMPLDKAFYEDIVRQASPEFQAALDSIVDFQQRVLEDLKDSGYLTNDAILNMRIRWPNHIPLYHTFEDAFGGTGSAMGARGKWANLPDVIKPIYGSTRDIIDPIEAIVSDTFYRLALSARNRAMSGLVDMANRYEDTGLYIEKVKTPMRPTFLTLTDLLSPMEQIKAQEAGLKLESLRSVWTKGHAASPKECIVRVWRHGTEEFYQLDPELYNFVESLDTETLDTVSKWLALPAKALSWGATRSPEFMLRNPIRDTMSATVNSKYGLTPIDLLRGWHQAIFKGDIYHQWEALGGAQSGIVGSGRSGVMLKRNWHKNLAQGRFRHLFELGGDAREATQREMAAVFQQGFKDKLVYLAKHPMEIINGLAETSEEGTRLAEFGKGVKWGKETDLNKLAEAALASRDLMDFSRSGNKGRIVNRHITFFNATLQGWDKMIRTWKEHPARTVLRGLAYYTAPTMALYAANRNNEEYWKLPQYVRDLFWCIPKPGGGFFTIPKPFEYGLIFATIPERIMRAFDNDPTAGEGIVEDLLLQQAPGLVASWMIPIIQVASNTSFSGAPIVPESEKNLPPEQQYGPRTSAPARLVGKAIKVSPRRIDAFLTGYFASVGKTALEGATALMEETGIVDTPPRPSKSIEQWPGFRGVMANPEAPPVQVDRIYDEKGELERQQKRLQAEEKDLSRDQATRLKQLGAITDAFSGQRKILKAIMEARTDQELDDLYTIHKMDIAGGDIHERKKLGIRFLRDQQYEIATAKFHGGWRFDNPKFNRLKRLAHQRKHRGAGNGG